jgi:hypothetical protein
MTSDTSQKTMGRMSGRQAMTGRRSAMLSLLLLAICLGATPNECESELVAGAAAPVAGRKPIDCSRRIPEGGEVPDGCAPSTATANPPGSAPPPACSETNETPCMRYHIQLVGDLMNPALRAEYSKAFGDACYVSESNSFNCWYQAWKSACDDAVEIGKVSGNLPYDPGYTCKPDGVGNYWLQIGPDTANRTWIFYDKAPRQTPFIPVDGVPTEVSGPYRNLVDPPDVGIANEFEANSGVSDGEGGFLTQKQWIVAVNKKNHGDNKIHSDLAGFMFPCEKGKPELCPEPDVLGEPSWLRDADPQVHHVVPMKDPRCCPWGTNTYKNAAVISAKLNRYFKNNDPPAEEVKRLNNAKAYTP